MNYYMIDSKTVRDSFLPDITKINKNDCLLYFENNASAIPNIGTEYFNLLKDNNINFKIINIYNKNNEKRTDMIQFIVASEIGFLVDKKNVEKIYIISKNKEFEAIEEFYKRNKNEKVKIIQKI